MNKSQRIYLDTTTNNDANINVRLEQDVSTIEFLSMSLSTEEVYQDFNSNYGVLIGRVIANDGIGIQNAKISIFIPLSDADATDGEIISIYPYTNPRDLNNEGKRYNLLPRVSKSDPITGLPIPRQPLGSFPIKEEIVTNPKFLNVYKKYYKYTAVTNESGDYMIFGLPIGSQLVHMSVDITDIGKYSMNPASMIKNLGYSPNYFNSDLKTIKYSSNLNDLPNIETQEINVNVIPFWGDVNNFDIGITRQDFRIRAALQTSFTLFGSAFTDSQDTIWGNEFSGGDEIRNYYRTPLTYYLNMTGKRIGTITEKIYYYPIDILDEDIDSGNVNTDNMMLLPESEYTVFKRNGDFIYIVNCNRKKVITDVFGKQIPIDDNSPNGIFTEFRGFVTLEYSLNELPVYTGERSIGDIKIDTYRYKLKFPQHANGTNGDYGLASDGIENAGTIRWRQQSFKFKSDRIYSFAKFHGTVYNDKIINASQIISSNNGLGLFIDNDKINQSNLDPNWNVGVILPDSNTLIPNHKTENYIGANNNAFGGNWLNLSIYLPQLGKAVKGDENAVDANYVLTSDHFSAQYSQGGDRYGRNVFLLEDNSQKFVAGEYNTKWFPRSDLNWTDIVEVPRADIINMNKLDYKGFDSSQIQLNGKYRNIDNSTIPNIDANDLVNQWEGAFPVNKINEDNKTYFYKGHGDANCIDFLIGLKII